MTTNFDPLIVKACAHLNEFPAVYDFASFSEYDRGFIHGNAIFYLHGQHTGFVQMTTPSECEKHSPKLEDVIFDTLNKRACIVIGYSGDNDPVLDHLIEYGKFRPPLFWVAYRDDKPSARVENELLRPEKNAFRVSSSGADEFFSGLGIRLGCFPPDYDSYPLTHLKSLVEDLPQVLVGRAGSDREVPIGMLKVVQQAILEIEGERDSPPGDLPTSGVLLRCEAAYMAGKYKDVLALTDHYSGKIPEELQAICVAAYVQMGFELQSGLEFESVDRQIERQSLAADHYISALNINWDDPNSHNNLGYSYDGRARFMDGSARDSMYSDA